LLASHCCRLSCCRHLTIHSSRRRTAARL